MKIRYLSAAMLSCLATQTVAEDCADGTRSFTDDRGIAVCIPTNPQRIVSTVDEAIFVPLYELGVTAVGTTASIGPDGMPFIRGGAANIGVNFDTHPDIAHIGDYEFMDYEAIAALEPDLIIVGHWGEWFNGDVDKMDLIAPTITINIEERTGFTTHEYLADVVGAEVNLAELRARYAHQSRDLDANIPDGVTASIIIPGDGVVYGYHTWPGLGQILRDAGVDAPQIINDIPEGQYAEFSVEVLPEFDADWVFISYANHAGETPADALAAMDALLPSWCEVLTTCQDGRVMPVPIEEVASWSLDAHFAAQLMLNATMGNPLNYR